MAKAKRNETKKYIGLSIITGVVTLIAAIAKGFTSAKLAAITERAVLAQVGINPDIANYEGTLHLLVNIFSLLKGTTSRKGVVPFLLHF